MAYIWSYLRRYPKWLAMNFTAAVLFVIANLGLPTVLARMIDEGINRGDVDKLYAYAWVMFGVVLTGIVGRILLSYAVGKLTTTMVQVMRNDIYAKLQEYSHHEYEQIGVSSLVTRITSDAFVLMQFADQVLKLGVITPLMMVSSVFLILTTSPQAGAIISFAGGGHGTPAEYGHVAFIEKLYPNGSFLISETNYNGNPNYTFRKLSGVDSNLSFAYTTK